MLYNRFLKEWPQLLYVLYLNAIKPFQSNKILIKNIDSKHLLRASYLEFWIWYSCVWSKNAILNSYHTNKYK